MCPPLCGGGSHRDVVWRGAPFVGLCLASHSAQRSVTVTHGRRENHTIQPGPDPMTCFFNEVPLCLCLGIQNQSPDLGKPGWIRCKDMVSQNLQYTKSLASVEPLNRFSLSSAHIISYRDDNFIYSKDNSWGFFISSIFCVLFELCLWNVREKVPTCRKDVLFLTEHSDVNRSTYSPLRDLAVVISRVAHTEFSLPFIFTGPRCLFTENATSYITRIYTCRAVCVHICECASSPVCMFRGEDCH